jgi:hypothetical protein
MCFAGGDSQKVRGFFGLGYSDKVPIATVSQAVSEPAFQCLSKGGGGVPTATARRKLHSGKSTWKHAKPCCFPLISAEQSANVQPNPHTPNKRTQTRKHQPQTPINPTTQGNTRTINRGAIDEKSRLVNPVFVRTLVGQDFFWFKEDAHFALRVLH